MMALARSILFVIPELPRPRISMTDVLLGHEALSGTLGSTLLIANELAARGSDIGLVIPRGQSLHDGAARSFASTPDAIAWAAKQNAIVIWTGWGERSDFAPFNAAGLRPWVWLQIYLVPELMELLEHDRIEGIIVVADLVRLTCMHWSGYPRVGRVHNPINPAYLAEPHEAPDRYASRRVVFTGYMGTSKGAHHVLRAWPLIRKRLPDATLTMAGAVALYASDRSTGPLRIADPVFEEKYLAPILNQFGSFDAAGIQLAGLMTPLQIRDLHAHSALGFLNPNLEQDAEACSCTANEMLASRLPILSVAAGGNPESIGSSGGAMLLSTNDPDRLADSAVALLNDPDRLRQMGHAGREFVLRRYNVNAIADQWERLLNGSAQDLDRNTGPWATPARRGRYLLERFAGYTRTGSIFELALHLARRIKHRGRQIVS